MSWFLYFFIIFNSLLLIISFLKVKESFFFFIFIQIVNIFFSYNFLKFTLPKKDRERTILQFVQNRNFLR